MLQRTRLTFYVPKMDVFPKRWGFLKVTQCMLCLRTYFLNRSSSNEYSCITSGLFFLLHVQTQQLILVNHFLFLFCKALGLLALFLASSSLPTKLSTLALKYCSERCCSCQRLCTSQQGNEDDLWDVVPCSNTVIPSFRANPFCQPRC